MGVWFGTAVGIQPGPVSVMADVGNSQLVDLLARIGSRDRSALADLYRAMEKPLYRFILKKLNDPFQSSDVLQDVFLDIWRNAGQFEGRSTAKSWMFGIAYRKVMDVFRKAARIDLTDEVPERADEETPNAEACLLAIQQAAHVRHCLDELKPQHRSAIELAFYEDMSYREIGEVMDVPEGTVKTRVFHAKQLLLRCLQGRQVMGA